MPFLRKLTADQNRSIAHWAMELVVVIAGVLIALWLQELVERRRAVQDMRAAENAIHDEVRGALTSLIWREAISRCHFERAKLLKSKLLSGGTQWPGLDENALLESEPPGVVWTVVPSIYQRPVDSFTVAAWNSALVTGALAPMDRRRFGRLVALYDQIQLLSDTRVREDEAASKLSALAFSVQLTPEVRSEMLQSVYEIDRSRFMFGLIGPSVFAGWMRELGWNDKREIDAWILENQTIQKRQGIDWRRCVAAPRNPFNAR